MTTVSQPVSHVVFSAAVNGVADSFTPLDFELRQGWGQQDILFGRTVVPKGRSAALLSTWPAGSPVQITWGRGPYALTTWYGYLNHAEISTSDDATGQNVQLTYVLSGTSKRMLSDTSKTWTGYTLSGIAVNLAAKYGMRAAVTQTTAVLNETQANESDWAFLVRMAAKYGLRLWVSGGTLYLTSPAAVMSGASNFVVPAYVINKSGAYQDSAQDFKLMSGDALPGAYQMDYTMSGLDSAGNVYTVQNDNPTGAGNIVESRWHASSPAMAKAIVDAEAALGQFWQVATVELMGYGLLYPGKIIALSGSQLPDGTSGQWMIAEAKHILKQSGSPDPSADHYVTRCTIIRNQKGYAHVKGVSKISPELIPCQLNGSVWQAQSIGTIIEGVM